MSFPELSTTFDLVADCPVRDALELLSVRWLPVIVYCLRTGPRRPSELRAELGVVSDQVLNQTLRRAVAAGLVGREVRGPHHVTYSLTRTGRGMLPVLAALGEWSELLAETALSAQGAGTALSAQGAGTALSAEGAEPSERVSPSR